MSLQEEIAKNLINESYSEDSIEISTGLTDDNAYDILRSVIGQLSDGIWENSPSMDKYWKYMDVDRKGSEVVVTFNIGDYRSGFKDKDEVQIKKWLANKVKQIVKEEGLDWNRDNTERCSYMHGNVTVQDAYRVYDKLLGRKEYIPDPSKKTEAKLLESNQELTNIVNQEFAKRAGDIPPKFIEFNNKKYKYWPLLNRDKGDGKVKCMYFYPADGNFTNAEEYFTVLYQKQKHIEVTYDGIDSVLEVDDGSN